MAEAYTRQRAGEMGLNDLVIESVGTLGIVGEPATSEAIATLLEQGIHLEAHRSRGLGPGDLAAADLVVVMTNAHRREIDRRFPAHGTRVELLRAYENGTEPAPTAPDLEDPIGQRIGVYRRVFEVIRRSADHLLTSLRHPA